LQRERIELADGDFIDLDWSPQQSGPLVVLLHGLEGSIRSHSTAGLMRHLFEQHLQTVLFYFRGCSGEPNRMPRSYHSGETGDLDELLHRLRERQPEREIYLVGISLGGNVLLKWLGENPAQTLASKAVAISVPFELNAAALRLDRGFSKIYQAYLLRKLRRSTIAKAARMPLPITLDRLAALGNFRAFDDTVTAPLHGFDGVDDYYTRSSSRQYLPQILTPTLILHARDDPFLPADAIPRQQELGPGIRIQITEHGGHVGFISGKLPWQPCYWLDWRVSTALLSAELTMF
jgi:predicted alpha/beta-fold hydrolase